MLSAAAVSSLHPERFAVGSAVNQTARQVGGAFGVALLVVILGTPHTPVAALDNFRHLWWYAAAMAVAVRSGLQPPPSWLRARRAIRREAGRSRRPLRSGDESGPSTGRAGGPASGRSRLPSPRLPGAVPDRRPRSVQDDADEEHPGAQERAHHDLREPLGSGDPAAHGGDGLEDGQGDGAAPQGRR